ncbi:glycosyltransferase involved in cell wall biosynthesis [Desulfomicrobium macestii]|uniref:Glycosyltransferase involved in cell wall biosynthesis n=1 Tax=Desulfomicrobium macestii TaxID=90731 RepID=A0ABR9H5T4_9BACT|nr:glycosyltransferase [Desulfomicrobium macestii]MBE1426050.1 glycosyltransferase involved in cell wall biosynthesis [Desulfomicrobium macestii]
MKKTKLISAIIFSKDRALQLELCLRTLLNNCIDFNIAKIHVIYTYSNDTNAKHYELLKQEYKKIHFCKETNFHIDLINCIGDAKFILFIVDDNIFINKFSITTTTDILKNNHNAIGFSLRLGKNIKYHYPSNSDQVQPKFTKKEENIYFANWTLNTKYFGYPLEVSSSIYKSDLILPIILSDKTIKNPNSLESQLHFFRNNFLNYPLLFFYGQSVAFCNPLNIVQTEYLNRHSGGLQNSAKYFANCFEKGERLFPNGLNDFIPDSCHQEVKVQTNNEYFYEPFISICIPTYNRDKYIKESIESALAQNYDKFEIVIVDDGSTDNTENIVRSIKSDKIRYVKKEHSNAPDTRNICIQEAEGEFILWLDSDDHLAIDLLTRFQELLADFPDIDVCYGDVLPFGNTGTFANKTIRYADYYKKNNELLAELVTGNKIPNPGTFIRKDLFNRVGVYDIQFKRAHDYEFWIRSAPVAKFKHIEGISVRWRWHESNMSASNKILDTSYESSILKKLVQQHPIEILFPLYDWNNQKFSSFLAHGEIAMMFLKWKNIFQYTLHLKKAIKSIYFKIKFPDDHSLQLKILSKCYIEIFNQTKNVYFQEMARIALNVSKII